MLRYQIFASRLVVFLGVWYAALQSETFQGNLWVTWAPVGAIGILGMYALSSVVLGVANLQDFPQAATEIEQNVVEAKAAMQKRGILL